LIEKSGLRRSVEDSLRLEQGLRFAPLYEGANSIVLSSRSEQILERARERLSSSARDVFGQHGDWPRPIECQTFAGYYLPQVTLDATGTDSAGFILAAAQEELAAEAQAAIRLLR